MQLSQHALFQHETGREETLRLIASLENHQTVPYRLLTKENSRGLRLRASAASLADNVLGPGAPSVAGVPSFGQGWWARQDSSASYKNAVFTMRYSRVA